MKEDQDNKTKEHNIEIVGRKALALTGAVEVVSAQDNVIFVKTNMGNLQIAGNGLRIEKLDLEHALVSVVGNISGVKYAGASEKRSFFAKLFR